MTTTPTEATKAGRLHVAQDFNTLRIYFHGMLHLCVPRRDLAVQSWRNDDHLMSIEYTTCDGRSVLTEYDKPEDWRYILSQLDNLL